MWNLSRILPLFLCFLPVFTEVYLNKWAVHIKGGHGAARQLAEKHGFHYVGQIGTLDDYYLLEHHGVSKRSTDAAHHHHSRLQDDEQVHWVEQQIVKKRVKRDLMVHGLPASALPFIDPEWNHQWYLHGGATGGYDMNVIPAWRRGYTGKGIVVTILDDGIERTHPDLSINYDPDASWDINSGDDDPMPRYDSFNTNRHGTRCAGEVAAKANNSYCVVGVAYNSRIGGVRMLDGDVSDYVEAQSLSLNPQHIDIYSASWGPDDNGSVVDGPAKLAMEAFIKGVLEGRNGKGSIFVWASGNGGSHFDSCNCDGYTNSIFTLSISSTSEHGTKPWYLEECSSTLATTYSSGQNYGERKIVTTDLHKKCTDAHTGTSASAPLAAGIVALALEANNDLTWRDMQYLVMLTARSEPFVDGKWRTNGIGRKFSHRYGYGLMDAAALVTLAERWKPVPEQHICMSEVMPVNKQITGHKIEVEVTSSGCMDTVNEIHYLEHVQAKISLKYTHRGDLQLHLVSPNGTRTTLLQKRQKDIHEREFHDWPFMSVHFWGEKPFGTWKLEVENVGKPENTGTLVKWQLILYGVSEDPYTPVHDHKTSGSSGRKNGGAEKNDDEAFAGDYENEVPEWRYEVIDQSVVRCHEECDEDAGCQGPEASDCYMCKHVRMRMNGPCVPNCPKGYFADLEAGVCGRCTTPCESCEGTGQEDCLSCIDGYYYLPNEAVCVTQCPDGSSPDEDSRTCATCSDECRTCVVGQADACTGCYGDLVVVGDRCMPPCQSHQFPDLTGRCRSCSSDCVTCHGLTRNDCDSCQAYLYLQGSTCVRNCDDGFHPAKSDDNMNICQRCPVSCRLCASDEVCSACTSGYQLDEDHCVPICPDGQYQHTNGDCKPCAPDCLTCTGGSQMDCVKCADDRSMLSGHCIPNCPDGQFVKMQPSHGTAAAGGETVECEQCHATCASCRDGSSTSCISCPEGRSLHSGSCVRDCAHGFHSSPSGCLPCHTSCATCTAGDEQHCTACSSGNMLLHGQCLDQCPRGYFAAEGDCKQCHSSCLACTGPASSDCSRCLHGQSLQNGVCHSGNVTTCPPKFYWNSKNKVCESCDRTCATCQGPGTNNCLSCHPPLKYYYRHHLCVLCCADGNSHGCCNCHPDTGVCMEIRNIVEPNDIKGVDSHQYPHSKSAPHEESFSHLFVGSIVFVGIFSVSSFLVVFGLLQARSHGRLCWSHKYERIPLYYSGRFAKLDLLSNGQKDHDEEEEEDEEDEQTETYNA